MRNPNRNNDSPDIQCITIANVIVPSLSSDLFLGIDSGGSKTACAIVNLAGQVVGRGRGPAANLSHVDPIAFVRAIDEARTEAMFSAGVTRDAVASACICLAGFAPEHEEDRVRALLDPLFLPARTSYGRDLDAALASVSGPGPGLVIVAGTGSVAYGRNASGDTHRAGGWGYLVGDEGSSYWIGCQALRLTLRAHDGRAPWSPLYEQVMIRSGSQSPVELDKRVYRENWKPSQIADYARLVVEFAHAGDPAALNLINQAASELSELATAVVRRLGLVNEPCGVVGGLWQAGHTLREPFEAVFHRTAPGMQVSEPLISPEEGAALLAMAAAG